nr:Cof-type HAD-IIB family hydrolase [Lachnospiraceae bacterium]
MSGKVIFFDIDGTIWDYKNKIPDSTIEAFKKLRANGHKRVLCTGRTKATLSAKELETLEYDGLIAGCGTYIEWEGKELFNKLLTWETVRDFVPAMRKRNIGAFLEGVDKLFIDWDYYTGSPYAEKFREELKEDCVSIDDAVPESRINKMSVEYIDIPNDEVVDFFGDEFNTIIHDFSDRSGIDYNVAEVIPKGHSKATGMKYICDMLGKEMKDTFAFGDSANDVEMLKAAGCGIAMGDGTEPAKEAADYVTSDMEKDGIWNGLKRF